jgi:hypothetical protein
LLLRTYLIATGVVAAVAGGFGIYLILVGASSNGNSSIEGLGVLLVLGATFGYLINYVVVRLQLDRHDGSIPMPGPLGAFLDVDEDESIESGSGGEPVALGDLPGSEAADDQVFFACPRCGLRATKRPRDPCPVCGYAAPSGTVAPGTAGRHP